MCSNAKRLYSDPTNPVDVDEYFASLRGLSDVQKSSGIAFEYPGFVQSRYFPLFYKGYHARYGRAVYTSSTAGEFAEHAGSAYNSSKHGLLGLMRSVAQDGGAYGVTSNAVLPGWVRTEMAEDSARAEAEERDITPEQVWEDRAAMYPPGRVATPREVAEMIAFLASEESSGVSGQAITVALGGTW